MPTDFAEGTICSARSDLVQSSETIVDGRCATAWDQAKRVLIYSHDTFGLGNIRRMVRIAEALCARDRSVSVLIVTGSPMLHAFRLSNRIDYVKLPCLSRDSDGVYGVRHLDLGVHDAVRMRSKLIAAAASSFNPDIVLVDKKPLGVERELISTLDHLRRSPRSPTIALLLRDIIDAPDVTREIWRRHTYHQSIAEFYDRILVVGNRSVFDVAEQYEFPESSRRMLDYCGYIDTKRAASTGPARRSSGTAQVLVQVGGGGDGVSVVEAYIAGLAQREPDPGFESRIIFGPEMAERDRKRLGVRAAMLPSVSCIDFSSEMGAELANADLVVSMGGYNSVCEILSNRKRAIIVPREKPVSEQRIRAEALMRRGLVEMIPMGELRPRRLIDEVVRQLSRASVIPTGLADLRFDGLENICDHLLGNQEAVPMTAPMRSIGRR
jgi:predicted glycosyltransferase